MAQRRYWNYKEDDLTRLLTQWMTGLHPNGRYFGYDFAPSADMNLGLNNSTTGFKLVEVSPLQESPFLSMLITRQGTIITEDTALAIGVISNGDPTNPRIDTIILTHERSEIAGGVTALYSIIEGTPAASPVAPVISDTLRQTIVGTLYVPANTTQLDDVGVVWTQGKKPTFANGFTLGANVALKTNASGNLIDSTVTDVELEYLSGVTSAIQTQLNGKQANITGAATTITSSDLTANRALISNGSGKVAVSTVTSTELANIDGLTANATELNRMDGITASTAELNYTDGVTSAIQTQLNGKQATITGGATTITSSNLTINRALISSGAGKVAVSVVTATELGYLDGVTSAIQTQLDAMVEVDSGGSSTTMKIKIIDIGDWDMDADTNKSVTHGLTAADIRHVSVMIRGDGGGLPVPLNGIFTAGTINGSVTSVSSTTISLAREVGFNFDSVGYDQTSYNRGWVTIFYDG